MTVMEFSNGKAKATLNLVHLGDRHKVVNIRMLTFDEKLPDEALAVIKNSIAWSKKKKAKQVWIPADRETPLDDYLREGGWKHGEFEAQLPGNAAEGWRLVL